MARPSDYSPELASRICEIVATHPYGLPTLCKMFSEIPTRETINVWRWRHKEFADMYTVAKQHQAELMAESIEDVAHELLEKSYIDEAGVTKLDAGMLGHARLVCDNRKWTAAKLAPRIYGDQKQVDQLQGEKEQLQKEIEELRSGLAEKHKKEY